MRTIRLAIACLIVTAAIGSQRLCADDSPKQDSEKKLLLRTYALGISFFDKERIVAEKDKRTYDVRPDLTARGIAFPAGSSAIYTPATKRLVLVNDADQILMFEALVTTDTLTSGVHHLEPVYSKP